MRRASAQAGEGHDAESRVPGILTGDDDRAVVIGVGLTAHDERLRAELHRRFRGGSAEQRILQRFADDQQVPRLQVFVRHFAIGLERDVIIRESSRDRILQTFGDLAIRQLS